MKIGLVLLLAACAVICGCSPIEQLGIKFLYKKAELPDSQILKDIPYHKTPDPDAPDHLLDLFLPSGKGWPVLVFIHGGGWTAGSKDLSVGGADVYGNIGRFYASQGVGVAVINYRLLPNCNWRDQLDDAAQAVSWVHAHIAEHGGDPARFFLMGHSAGGELCARIAFDPKPFKNVGASTFTICGVITVSGAALDLNDRKTYQLGEKLAYYEKRFREGDTTDRWKDEVSPVNFVRPGGPPFLVLYAGGEKKGLQRQSERFREVLSSAGIPSQLVVVPGESHERIVLTLSRSDKTAGPAILEFIQKSSCR